MLNPLKERRQFGIAAFNAFQKRFPLPGHRRTFHLRVYHFDQVNPFVGGFQSLALALNIAALQEHFNDGGPCCRGAQAGVFHRIGQLFLVQRFARRLHRGQQRRVGKALGWPGLFQKRLGLQHILQLIGAKTRRQHLPCAVGRLFRTLFRLTRLLTLAPDIQDFPADLAHHRAGGMVVVHDSGIRDGSDYRSDIGDEIVVPGREQAAAHQIVKAALFLRNIRSCRRRNSGNDRMVIRNLCVVNEARTQRPFPRAGGDELRILRADVANDGRQRFRHGPREVAAVGPRITQQLVFFVERLRDLQRLLRAESVEAVGVALQFRKVIQRGRPHALRLRLQRCNLRLAGAGPRDNFLGLVVVLRSRQPHCLLQRLFLFVEQAVPGALIAGTVFLRCRFPRRKRCGHFAVFFGHELADGEFALHNHRQRGGLHAAHRKLFAEGQRVGTGEVHPD